MSRGKCQYDELEEIFAKEGERYEFDSKTFFETNFYDFTQKRLKENTFILKIDDAKDLQEASALNPERTYGEVTKYVAIDCEFDQGHGKNVPCKVSIVNSKGEIIVDTLIHNSDILIRSHKDIHGIDQRMLIDAPKYDHVRDFVMSICQECIFVGHSVKQDLKVMGIGEVYFIDTATAMDGHQPKKLKDVAGKQLNAFIQEGIHSSLVDARAALAIFRKH